jgi:uncharacterized protein (TIGR02271 family)
MTKRATTGSDRLVPLGSVDGFRLAEDEPDIRGWPVLDADGASLGVVRELLVDPRRGDVAAAEVAEATGAGAQARLLPMEAARVDDARRVVTTTLRAAEVPAVAERGARAQTQVSVERTADGEEVVRVPIVREELVVERRPVVKEVVVVRKRMARETRVVEADLRRERLDVERHGDV